jgi:hypothetical protein
MVLHRPVEPTAVIVHVAFGVFQTTGTFLGPISRNISDARFCRLVRRAEHVRKPQTRARQVSKSSKHDSRTQIASFRGVAQSSTRAAPPNDSPYSVGPSRGAIPFPTVDVTTRSVAVGTDQHQSLPTVPRKRPPAIRKTVKSPSGRFSST